MANKNAKWCHKYRVMKKVLKSSNVTNITVEEDGFMGQSSPEVSLEWASINHDESAVCSGEFTSATSHIYPSQPQLKLNSETNFDIGSVVSSYTNSSDNTDKFKKLRVFLKYWAIDSNVNRSQLNSLLQGLKRIMPEWRLPVDSRTLLKTQRNLNITEMKSRKDSIGQFFYFGLISTLNLYFQRNDLLNEIQNYCNNCVYLSFNIDGLPLFKSSNIQFWPILCRIHLVNFKVNPFPVAIFCGDSKPSPLEDFLNEFITEWNMLLEQGLVFQGIMTVKLVSFSCDAPARSYVKCIKGHNGKYACERCTQIGVSYRRRTVYLELESELRTHESFTNQTYPGHHLTVSPLTRIYDINMIMNFTLDYMHLCCLGVMRKLLVYWLKGAETKPVRLHISLRKRLSSTLQYCSKFVPSDFNRKPRSLVDIDRFKATEFRLFLLYLGPLVLKTILKKELYEHFLRFHCGIRILVSPQFLKTDWIKTASQILNDFVDKVPVYYGKDACVYNVHNLRHIADDVANLNCTLDELSCFPFESYLGKLKRLLRTPNRPLAQICKRLSESNSPHVEKCCAMYVVNKEMRFVKFPKFTVRINDRDCFVLTSETKIFKVIDIIDDQTVSGYLSTLLTCFYKYPIPSSHLGIYKFTYFQDRLELCPINSILSKVMIIPHDDCYVTFELIHS